MIVEDWEVLKSHFPKNWRWLAGRSKALKGLRKDKDPEQILRAILIHLGCGLSLRETSVRIRQSGLSNLSDVALLKRLRKCKTWLQALCMSLMREARGTRKPLWRREFRLFDSTNVKEQGLFGSLWRIHYSLRVPSLRCDFIRVSSAKGKGNGDTLLQYPVAAGDYVIADRGFSQAAGIHHIASHGAYVCVRVNQTALPLQNPDGSSFDLLKHVEDNLPEAGAIGEWNVTVPVAGTAGVAGRICAIRKSELAIKSATRKVKRRASKKGQELKPETLRYAAYVILFTTFPAAEFTAKSVLDDYRFRWQIELIFKRLKQLVKLGHLPKKDKESVVAWLYGKLFIALLTQRLIDHGNFISPWGYDVERITHPKPLA